MAVSIEAQGHTVDEAIQIALNQLGVSRDKVEIDILHHPRRGILGIGARRAKVRATLRENVLLDGEEFDMSGGTALDEKPRRRRRRGGRNRERVRGDEREGAGAPPRAEPERRGGDQPRAEGRVRGDDTRGRGDDNRERGGDARRGEGQRGRGRDERRGRGGRGERRGEGRQDQRQDQRQEGRADSRPEALPQPNRPEPREGRDQRGEARPQGRDENREPRTPSEGRDARSERPQRRDDRGRDAQGERRERQRPRIEESAAQAAAEIAGDDDAMFESRNGSGEHRTENAPLDAAQLDAIRVRAEELVRQLLAKMGFAAEVQSSVDEAAGEAVVSVRSESEGLLIGRRGQTLDSLEHIVNRMTLRGDAYAEGRILLDIGDYRRRRRESLEELAGRLRARAVGERRTVQVSPMSPRDRKFFAQAFAADEGVEVRSLGAGFYRRVVVAPAGMAAGSVETAESVEDETMEQAGVEADA